jgi:hypothetical protein
MDEGNGTATFTNPDDYQAAIGSANVDLIFTSGEDFRARLTWLNLRHLHILSGRENLPRIAYISLPPARVFVSFLTSAAPRLAGRLIMLVFTCVSARSPIPSGSDRAVETNRYSITMDRRMVAVGRKADIQFEPPGTPTRRFYGSGIRTRAIANNGPATRQRRFIRGTCANPVYDATCANPLQSKIIPWPCRTGAIAMPCSMESGCSI